MRTSANSMLMILTAMVLCHAPASIAGVDDAYWAPTSLVSTIVWLDASDPSTLWKDTGGVTQATTTVARWDDKSGNGNHMLQVDTNKQPVTGSRYINGVYALDFDGANDTMQESANAFGSVISNTSVFMVAQFDSLAHVLYLDTSSSFKFETRYSKWLSLTVNGSVNWGDGWMEWSNPVSNLLDVVSMNEFYYSVSSNVFKAYLDCVQQTFNGGAIQRTANGTVSTSQGISVPTFDGLVAEIIILDDTITTNDRQIVEGYLAWKWEFVDKLPLDHPFKEEPPNNPPAGTVIIVR